MNDDSPHSASVETVNTSDATEYSKSRLFVEGNSKVKFYRLGKTVALFVAWVCLGLYNEVVGPTLPDLKQRIGCNYEEIGRVLSARSAGLFIGSIAGGLVHDRWPWNRDLFIALALAVSAVTIVAAPWCQSLWQLGIVFHLMGNSHAFLTTGGNPLLAFLWAEKSSGAFNFLHSGFGLGATTGSILSKPFLSVSRAPVATNDWWNGSMTSLNDTLRGGLNDTSIVSSRIEYPYAIVGTLCGIMSIIFIGFYLGPSPTEFAIPRPSSSRTSIADDVACPNISGRQQYISAAVSLCTSKWFQFRRLVTLPDFCFQFAIRSLMFLFYLFIIGGTSAFGKFVFSFAVVSPSLHFSKSEATLLTFIYWVCYTSSRLIVVVVSRFIAIHWLLLFEVSGLLSVSVGLMTLASRLEAFWTLSSMFGFFQSPLFPSGLGWANQYIEITSTTIAIINIGSSVGGMIIQWFTGFAFQYYGPDSFLYITVMYSAAIFVLFVVLHVVGKRHGSRFQTTVVTTKSNSMSAVATRLRAAVLRCVRVRQKVVSGMNSNEVEMNGNGKEVTIYQK